MVESKAAIDHEKVRADAACKLLEEAREEMLRLSEEVEGRNATATEVAIEAAAHPVRTLHCRKASVASSRTGAKRTRQTGRSREGTAPALVSMARMRRPLAGTRRVQSTMRREALARFRTRAFGRCRRIRCRAMRGRPWRLVGIRRGQSTICPPPWTSRSRRTGGRRRHDRRPRRPSQSSRGGRILRRRRRRTRFQGRGRMAERG